MSVTFNCSQVGQKSLWNESAFKGREVKLSNPFKQLSNDEFKAVQVFITKKEAVEFCKTWGFTQSGVIAIHSRFQRAWAINLGHSYFVPDHAQGLLFAHRMGCVVDSIKDERMWMAA
jgi:hypothetical protein